MALDPALELRQAIVRYLRSNSALTLLVPADQIFGEQPVEAMPERPFIRYGEDDTQPRRTSCWDGASIEFPMHAFSAEKNTDEVKGLNRAIAFALDGKVIEVEPGLVARLKWLGSRVMRDAGDPNAWHGFSRFEATF